MNYVIRLTFFLLMFVLSSQFALSASIQPGSYISRYNGKVLTITLDKDGHGYFEGETHNAMEWKQEGNHLLLKFYGEEGSEEFEVRKADIANADTFVLDGQQFKRGSNTVYELRGPKIHGLQLGMSRDDAIQVMNTIAERYGEKVSDKLFPNICLIGGFAFAIGTTNWNGYVCIVFREYPV